LIFIVLVIALAAAWYAYHANWRRERANALIEYDGTTKNVQPPFVPLPYGLRMLEAQPQSHIRFRRICSEAEIAWLARLFPESVIVIPKDDGHEITVWPAGLEN
jgi:hypothetical protein